MKTLEPKKFRITYSSDGEKEKVVTRKASNAVSAVEKLCEQYGWQCNLKLFDSDKSRGMFWAECQIKTDEKLPYYDMTAYADLIED